MTIHERRAGRRRRERVITLNNLREAFLFWRGLGIVASSAAPGLAMMTVFRVDRRKGKLHVTVPVWP